MDKTSTTVISREASDKTKGFRLQKLRCAKLMLDTIERYKGFNFYAAIEVVEDVTITIISDSGSETKFEEDKNFDDSKNFTLFSPAVLNTLVSFFDVYNNYWKRSQKTVLSFYTTAGIGKEKKKSFEDGTAIVLPDEPILEILKGKTPLSDAVTQILKSALLEEYAAQYADKTSKGNLDVLNTYTLDELKGFFSTIEWHFGQEDELALKLTVLDKIKHCKHFNLKHANKEEIILALILERLDEKQNLPDFADRFLHDSHIELIFKQAESEEVSDALDPVWEDFSKLESEITDRRSLTEKVLSACPDYPISKQAYLARVACRAKSEQKNGNKSFLSLKYRVYEACCEYYYSHDFPELPCSQDVIDTILKALKEKAYEHIEELKKDYTYTQSSRIVLDGMIMDLIDTCFLSFEEIA